MNGPAAAMGFGLCEGIGESATSVSEMGVVGGAGGVFGGSEGCGISVMGLLGPIGGSSSCLGEAGRGSSSAW